MSTIPENPTSLTADEQIFQCLQPNLLKSFFLFAGAGSGKTRSLVNALQRFRKESGVDFRLQHKKIAVITYTKAASNVIKERMEFDPLFSIATIHHFCWELIQHYQHDIRDWRAQELQADIATLESQLQNGRSGKTAEDRKTRLARAKERFAQLPHIRKFIYSPDGDNRTRDSLNHSQVIKIATEFLRDKPLLRQILINKFPIIFIDEAQDTRKELIEVLFTIQAKHASTFAIGLFGDTMQRIYLDGKDNLGTNLPADWIIPEKTINYRCSQRIVRLINQIRSQVDHHQQEPAPMQPEGFVRLFIIDNSRKDKMQTEKEVGNLMADITEDKAWENPSNTKKLILEHHMAANRLEFANLYEALNSPESYRTSFLDGTLSSMQVFTKMVLPVIIANRDSNAYEIMRLIRNYSPLLSRELLKSTDNQLDLLESVSQKVNQLLALWENGGNPNIKKVASQLKESGLFTLPEVINIILSRDEQVTDEPTSDGNEPRETGRREEEIAAWENTLSYSFSEIAQYQEYISESSGFGTHQGVKGLEFPRVMVILDDESARGNLFKYERLFGVESLSERDLANKKEGKETTVDRTRRLLYVACSRAEESLAVVAYTNDTAALAKTATENGWFSEQEIQIMS